MEAHDATQPETGAEQTQQTDQGQQSQETSGYEQLLDQRFADLREEIPQLIGGALQQYQQQQPEEVAQGQQDPFDDFASLFEENYGETMQQQAAQGVDPSQLRDAFQGMIQQALQPIQERFLDQEADALEREYPALQDPKTQREVVAEAIEFAQALGVPELARQPKFIKKVFEARMASERAAQETPAGGSDGVALETGGGAAQPPQQSTSDDDIRQMIVGSGGGGGLFGS